MLYRLGDSYRDSVKPRRSLALLLAIVLLTAAGAQAQTIPQTTGIFAMNPLSNAGKVSPSILSNPSVKGILLTQGWNQIEATEGVYNWTLVDSVISQAASHGKLVVLGVAAGYQTPSWVFTDGAKSFQFLWDRPKFGPALCSVQSIPVPWNSIFQQKWQTFVQAMGARYSPNTTVASVMMYGLNFHSVETSLPITANQPISSGTTSCVGYNYPALWQAAGYTRTKVEIALSQMQSTFQAAFPLTQLLAPLNPAGFPPIDENGNLIPGRPEDDQIPNDLLANGAANLGAQFAAGNGGLTATGWTWSVLTQYASTLDTGYQTITALGTGLPNAITAALNGGARWLQLYPSDIGLAANQSAIISAAATLH